jgi:predicted MFS family arabinose efflux permease
MANLIYAPSLVAIRETYQTTNAMVGLTVAVYGLLLATCQLLAGPVADRFSAKRVLVGGLVLYSLSSALAFAAGTIEVFILARAIQATGAATGLVVGGAIVTDRYPPETRARAMGTLQMANAVGGTLGPVTGSLLANFFPWQADSVVLLLAGVALAVAAARFLPDVSAPAQRLTLEATLQVMRYPVTAAVLLMAAGQWFAQFVFIAYVPFLLRERVGLPESVLGLLLLPITLGVFTGSNLGGRFAERWGARKVVFGAVWTTSVFTLLAALVGWLDVSAWTIPALAAALLGYGLSLGTSVPPQLAMMVERFTRNRGAAVGTYASLRYFGGAAGPAVTGLLLEPFGVAAAFAASGGLIVAATLLGHILVSRGER